ncbi:MAG: HAMP domain-containing histidine kinase [Acidobacteria bacterium]|nr:HAMP domain-containing histidine kinase [Acidobacteriota bacterium]
MEIRRVPLRLLTPFLCLLLLPLSGLVWMGSRLLDQDRLLEARRSEEQLDRAMEKEAAEIRLRITSTAQRLDCREGTGPRLQNATKVEFRPDRVRVCAGEPLAWVPLTQPEKPIPEQTFRAAEKAEFADRNGDAALHNYRALFAHADSAIRAGALLRAARVLRSSDRAADALPLYQEMAQMTGVQLSGLPADLVARAARCRVLEQLGRTSELRAAAGELAHDLDRGRWAIDRAAFELHRGDAAAWSNLPRNSAAEQIAATAADVYTRWKSGKLDTESSGVLVLDPFTILWRAQGSTLFALIGGREYVERTYLASQAAGAIKLQLVSNSQGGADVRRYEGIPWLVRGVWSQPPASGQEFAQRRRLVLSFLGVAVLLTAASAWFLWRAFSHQRALARLQSDFVSAVSHEFRTPLTSMKQISEVLTEGRLIQEDRRQTYYESLGRATQRLQRLVESLLDFGRMEANAMPYRKDPICLQEMIEPLITDFADEYGPRGFKLAVEPLPENILIRGDREALHQAVWNLLDNAVKYSNGEKTVWLETGRRGDFALVRVRDRGAGIPQSERRRVSEKFFRGEFAKSAGIKGTGIGLSLVTHILRSHGGSLEVESAPGEGCTFTIALPIRGNQP